MSQINGQGNGYSESYPPHNEYRRSPLAESASEILSGSNHVPIISDGDASTRSTAEIKRNGNSSSDYLEHLNYIDGLISGLDATSPSTTPGDRIGETASLSSRDGWQESGGYTSANHRLMLDAQIAEPSPEGTEADGFPSSNSSGRHIVESPQKVPAVSPHVAKSFATESFSGEIAHRGIYFSSSQRSICPNSSLLRFQYASVISPVSSPHHHYMQDGLQSREEVDNRLYMSANSLKKELIDVSESGNLLSDEASLRDSGDASKYLNEMELSWMRRLGLVLPPTSTASAPASQTARALLLELVTAERDFISQYGLAALLQIRQ